MSEIINTALSAEAYLERLLLRYSGTFDIHKPYHMNGREYPAYGYFYSCVEKYVLVREANMWTSNSYEHILFLKEEICTLELLKHLEQLVVDYMEPELVRNGKQYPPDNHMYTYLTFAIICDKAPSAEVRKALKKFKFEKGYKFNMLGFSQAHIICASMEDEKVITNYAGRKSKTLYKEVFHDVKAGKPGFSNT